MPIGLPCFGVEFLDYYGIIWGEVGFSESLRSWARQGFRDHGHEVKVSSARPSLDMDRLFLLPLLLLACEPRDILHPQT